MKIVHVSDIHIRNLKYHDEYRRVFENLYKKIEELKPDIVINTGDTAHTKTQISPEFVEMCSEHIRRVAELAPYHIILGNHDLNLANSSRQDAITPVVDSIGSDNVFLHKKSGEFVLEHGGKKFRFFVFSCADQKNYPEDSWTDDKDSICVGLFHGSLPRVEVDSGFKLEDADTDTALFDGLDYVLLGDIHKHQFINGNKKIAYAGSLVQQNFGEDPDKGFLFWDIRDKNDWDVEHIELKGNNRFFTLRLNEDLSIPDVEIDENSRVRIISPKSYTIAEQQIFEDAVKKKFNPYDVISLASSNIGKQNVRALAEAKNIKIENLRDIEVQERLIRQYLKDKSISDDVMDKILEINKKYQIIINKNEEVIRDVNWRMEKLAWNNMFKYGEDNVIDFTKLSGIIGIFAPNSSGKSSFIDIILETIFDRITKGSMKNIHMINDNKQSAQMLANVTIGDESYIIERGIERVKYGKRKFNEEKEWGKTTLNFFTEDSNEQDTQLNGTLRPETERAIRKKLGTYDDFVLTAVLAQNRKDDIINCKETDRRKILSKFLDLDVFEQKEKMAKDESKEYFKRLKDFDNTGVAAALEAERQEISVIKDNIKEQEDKKAGITSLIELKRKKIDDIKSKRFSVSENLDENKIMTEIQESEERLSVLGSQLTQLINDISENQEEIEASEKALSEMDVDKDALEDLVYLEGVRDGLKTRIASEKKKLKLWEKDVSLLDEVPCGDQFPTCKFLVNAFDKKSMIPDQQDKINNLEVSLKDTEDKILEHERKRTRSMVKIFESVESDLSERNRKVKQLELKKENLELKIDTENGIWEKAKSDLEKYKENQAALEKNKEIDAEVKTLEAQLKNCEDSKSHINENLMEFNRRLGAKESVVEKIEAEVKLLDSIRVTCDAFEYYTEAMGKKGIAYDILIEKLPLLNEEINKILSTVASFNVLIENDEDENSIKLFIKYGDYKMRPLELGGGAEKMLSSIAIRSALLNVTNLPKSNLFIIDEGFGSLDPKNLDNISKMFDYLRSRFDHVLIISHLEIMKDIVDSSIEITIDEDRYSKISVS